MKSTLSYAVIAALMLQTVTLSAGAQSRVDSAITASASQRQNQINELAANVKSARQNIAKLEADLVDAKDSAGTGYKAGVIIRKASLIAVGVSLASLVVLGVKAAGPSNGNQDNLAAAILMVFPGIATIVGGIGAAAGQGLIMLTDEEVDLVQSQLKVAKTQLSIMERKLKRIQG